MSKALLKLVLGMFAAVVVLGVLHAWQNIGFDRLGFGAAAKDKRAEKFRVGFLPVT